MHASLWTLDIPPFDFLFFGALFFLSIYTSPTGKPSLDHHHGKSGGNVKRTGADASEPEGLGPGL